MIMTIKITIIVVIVMLMMLLMMTNDKALGVSNMLIYIRLNKEI